ncbi:MAG: hypothetical protein GYA59_17495 [Chloroflexi bacterium]|nr:hypothetical protein [Chloroflexota bacterium]
MKALGYRICGVMLLGAALLGVVISLAGLVVVWRVQAQVVTRVQNGLDLLDRTLDSTGTLLAVAEDSLQRAEEDLALLSDMSAEAGLTLETTTEVTTHLGDLLGEDLTAVVTETQKSLDTAQTSAKLIDDTLRLVSAVPFIGAAYKPEVPLQESVAEVSASLDAVPKTLAAVQSSLLSTTRDTQTLQADLGLLSENLLEIQLKMGELKQVTGSYQQILGEAQADLQNVHRDFAGWVRGASLGISLLLFWLLLSQPALLFQGLALLQRAQQKEAPAP